MKSNFKFFGIVSALLLLSSIVLIGCMHVIASDYGEAKTYDMGRQISTDGSIIVGGDAPTSQSELQEKFGAMYDVSEDGKTVTVISEEYLNKYWQSNYEKEVIRSLTTEEVFFVIQDSIRLYQAYDTVILGAFDPGSSAPQAAERFPVLEGVEVSALAGRTSLDRDRIEKDIHTIILYRLKALSSPKAFFTAEEALRFDGKDPMAYDDMWPESVFYIPGYSSDTDRDYILFIMGGGANFTDPERFTDLFGISMFGTTTIDFSSIKNNSTTDVFPTEDLYQISVPDGPEASNDDPVVNNPDSDQNTAAEEEKKSTPYFKLNTEGKTCSLMASNGNTVAEGIYVQEGDMYALYLDDDLLYLNDDFRYVFYYDESGEFRYAKGESTPIPEYAFEDGKRFALDGYVLFPVEG